MMLAFTFGLTLALFPIQDEPPAKPKPIYDEAADGSRQIADALARVAQDDRRVLIVWGGNWCGSCKQLDKLMKRGNGPEPTAAEKALVHVLQYEFEVVHLDVGRFDKQIDLVRKWRADVSSGVPALTVLSAAGKVVANRDNPGVNALIEGDDVTKLAAFLDELKSPAPDAGKRLDDALARAKAEQKKVFVHFGAPWCGTCRKLDGWLVDPAVAPVLGKSFVECKIDVDRMPGGKDILTRYRKGDNQSIPWFAILEPDGALAGTSDVGEQSVGMPVKPEEIEFVVALLGKHGAALEESDLGVLRDSLARRAD